MIRNSRGNAWLEERVIRLIEMRRDTDLDLYKHPSARMFNLKAEQGYELLEKLAVNGSFLVKYFNGPFQSSTKRGHLKDSNKSRALALRNLVPTVGPTRELVIPVLDWLYGLAYYNGEYGWGKISRNNIHRIRETRINDTEMTREAVGRTFEFVLGNIPDRDAEKALAFIAEGVKSDSTHIPECAVCVDTEDVAMHPGHYVQLANSNVFDEVVGIPRDTRTSSEQTKNKLALIMFGNGHSWTVILRFPYYCESRVEGDGIGENFYRMRFVKRDKELDSGSKKLLTRLSNFSVAYGCNIRKDLDDIKEALMYIYEYPWEPPKALDIASLMVLAGYDLAHHKMSFLSYIILGTVMNKRVSEMNNLWAFRLDDLEQRDPELGACWYLFNDLKCGFNMMAVMFNWLFLEAFPDPATVIMSLKTTEDKMRTLFMLALSKTVGDRMFSYDELVAAPNRRADKVYKLSGCIQSSGIVPEEKKLLDDLLDLFPSIPHGTYGGARYIEPIREHFVRKTVPALQRLFRRELEEGTCQVLLDKGETSSPEWQFKFMMGHCPDPDLALSQPGTRKSGLTVHPELRGLVADFTNVTTMKHVSQERDRIVELRRRDGIPCSAGNVEYNITITLLEGGFHLPEKLPGLLDFIENDHNNSKKAVAAGNRDEVIPFNSSKALVIKDLYRALTGQDIGKASWENIRINRANRCLNMQRNAKGPDSNRGVRVDVMEAAIMDMEHTDQPQKVDPMGQILQNIPVPQEKTDRNQISRKSRKRKRARRAEASNSSLHEDRLEVGASRSAFRLALRSGLREEITNAPARRQVGTKFPRLHPGLRSPSPSSRLSESEQMLVNDLVEVAQKTEWSLYDGRRVSDAICNDNVLRYGRIYLFSQDRFSNVSALRAKLRDWIEGNSDLGNQQIRESRPRKKDSRRVFKEPPIRRFESPSRSPTKYCRTSRRLSSPARPARQHKKLKEGLGLIRQYMRGERGCRDPAVHGRDPRADSPELFMAEEKRCKKESREYSSESF